MAQARSVTDSTATDRDRVADYVRRALTRLIAKAGCDWPLEVEGDEAVIRAALLRGELVISDTITRWNWWEPVSKQHGDRLAAEFARVLLGWWKTYRDADDSGWRYVVRWEDEAGGLYEERQPTGRAVTVHLAPGVRFGTTAGGSLTMLYRLGYDAGVPLGEAEVLGWARVE